MPKGIKGSDTNSRSTLEQVPMPKGVPPLIFDGMQKRRIKTPKYHGVKRRDSNWQMRVKLSDIEITAVFDEAIEAAIAYDYAVKYIIDKYKERLNLKVGAYKSNNTDGVGLQDKFKRTIENRIHNAAAAASGTAAPFSDDGLKDYNPFADSAWNEIASSSYKSSSSSKAHSPDSVKHIIYTPAIFDRQTPTLETLTDKTDKTNHLSKRHRRG